MKTHVLRTANLLIGLWLCLVVISTAEASDAIKSAGDILQYALPTVAVVPIITHKDKKGVLQYAESMGLNLAVTYTLKYAVNESRPNGVSQSFPSAHTSVSFTAAEFMRKRYGWEYGIPAYAVASFVGYSRVESREHAPHDVVAGAAIGILSSYIFTKPYKGWQVQAEGDSKYLGIRLSRSW